MSKIFKKENMMPVIVLTAISIIIAAVLGVANMFTHERIDKNENDKKYASLKEVIDGTFEPMDKPEGAPESVENLYKVTDDDGNVKGHAVTLKVQGYASIISLTVGVDADGKVTKAVVTSQQESHGKAGMASYTDNFTGVAKDDLSGVDTFSGATVSSTAIKNAIIDAVNVATGDVKEPEPEVLPTTDAEIEALAKALVGKDVSLTNVTPAGKQYTKRIYKAGSEGYVAYTLVISQYGTPETETLVFAGNNGKIIDVEKVWWKTSDAMYGYVPPTDDVVNAFYEKLIGKKASDLTAFEKADLVSNATNTSTSLRDAIVEALTEIEGLIKKDMPTPEDEIKALAKTLVGADVTLTDLTPDGMDYTRRVYKAGDEGYVAYTVVISQYGTPETETLVFVGNDGKIRNVNKILWKTSDAVETPYYSYYPPEESTVNAFYEKLVGKKASDLTAFEKADLVSNATNTSTSLRDALVEALTEIEGLIKKDMPTPEAQLKTLAKELIGRDVELTDVTPEGMEYVRRIYDAGKDGYVVYTVVISRYGTPETETLLHVGRNGKIKDINKITWKTSDAMYGYVPPEEATVNAFYEKLIGKSAREISGFGSAELVSNATNTSTSLQAALVEGLQAVEELSPNNTARIIGIALLCVAVLSAAAYKIVPVIIRKGGKTDEQ